MPIHTPDTALQRVHHDLQRLSQNLAQLHHELVGILTPWRRHRAGYGKWRAGQTPWPVKVLACRAKPLVGWAR